MILTKAQEEAVKIAVDHYKSGEKYTCIAGYAGSGKSTTIRFIIEALGIPEEQICYTAFTGKAAQVLYKKGNKNVSTLHKLLYKSVPLPNGGFKRMPVESLPYKLIIVDEVSMPDIDIMKLLFSHNVHIICCGDPFQIPPIDPNKDNHILDKPHVFLKDIMRQAQESEIIRISMDIRAGRTINPINGEEAIIIHKEELNTGMLKWADQIICSTNKTRKSINNQMRRINGIESDLPVDGDKLICCRNYWDKVFGCDDPLINGTIGYLKNSFETYNQLPPRFKNKKIPIIKGDLYFDENTTFKNIEIDKTLITTGKKCLDNKTAYLVGRDWKTRHLIPLEFDYGFVATGHRAQGSEWEKVLVIEESFPFDREEHARWLYTTVTRASEKLVLVLK